MIAGGPIKKVRAREYFSSEHENMVQWFELTPEEIAALWHLPNSKFTAPKIEWLTGVHVPAPQAVLANTTGVCLGDNHIQGKKHPIYLKNEDRVGHMMTFGRTQFGKSTFLHNLIHQDIEAGHGLAVIDPHGTLVSAVLAKSIPAKRLDDVVVWDLANQAYPPPLNFLATPAGFDRSVAAAQILALFERVWSDFGATLMASNLKAALATILADNTPTLRDVHRVFYNKAYRDELLEKADSIVAEEVWERFDKLGEKAIEERVEPVVRRLQPFYDDKLMYPIMCHPKSLDVASLMRQGKIILISLKPSEGVNLPPYTSNLLASLWISQLEMAAMAGAT